MVVTPAQNFTERILSFKKEICHLSMAAQLVVFELPIKHAHIIKHLQQLQLRGFCVYALPPNNSITSSQQEYPVQTFTVWNTLLQWITFLIFFLIFFLLWYRWGEVNYGLRQKNMNCHIVCLGLFLLYHKEITKQEFLRKNFVRQGIVLKSIISPKRKGREKG